MGTKLPKQIIAASSFWDNGCAYVHIEDTLIFNRSAAVSTVALSAGQRDAGGTIQAQRLVLRDRAGKRRFDWLQRTAGRRKHSLTTMINRVSSSG